MDKLQTALQASIETKQKLYEQCKESFFAARDLINQTIKNGNTIFIAGNGGSAADAQHRAAEITGRYKTERKSLAAIALTTDTSALTAIANDYGYEYVFSRQLEGVGKKGDLFIGISTSGNSGNIIQAIHKAQEKGINVVTLLGKTGGKIKDMPGIHIIVPSNDTPRIQECHELMYHTLCEYIDDAFTD